MASGILVAAGERLEILADKLTDQTNPKLLVAISIFGEEDKIVSHFQPTRLKWCLILDAE